MFAVIQTETKLRGEQRSKINAGINKGLDMLRAKGYGLRNVNVNGAIVVTDGDPQAVADYLSKHPVLGKFVTFEVS